jgi:hypothetical protein
MALGKPRDPRKEQQWRRWIDQWQRSRLSVRAFCARHGLATAHFYAWRRELRQRDAATAFVPVRVVPDPEPSPTERLEILLVGGRRLCVRPGFDPALLRQLVAILEEVPPC